MYQEQYSERIIYSFDEGYITETDCSEYGGIHYLIYFKDEDFKYADEFNQYSTSSEVGYDKEQSAFYFIFIDKEEEMNGEFFSELIELAKDEIKMMIVEIAEMQNTDLGADVASELVKGITIPFDETDRPQYLREKYFEIKDDFQNTVFEELSNVFTANDFFEACEDNDNRVKKMAEEYIVEYEEMENQL